MTPIASTHGSLRSPRSPDLDPGESNPSGDSPSVQGDFGPSRRKSTSSTTAPRAALGATAETASGTARSTLWRRLRSLLPRGKEPPPTSEHNPPGTSDKWQSDGNWWTDGDEDAAGWRASSGRQNETASIEARWRGSEDDIGIPESFWTGDWKGPYEVDKSETAPLTSNGVVGASDTSIASYQTLLDPDAKVDLNLPLLYQRIGEALPDDFEVKPPIRANGWLPAGDSDRPKCTEAAHIEQLRAAVQQCKRLPRVQTGSVDTFVETLEAFSKQLGIILSNQPLTNAPESLAKICAALYAGLSQARRHVGDNPMEQAAFAACEQRARAIVIDIATSASLTGKPLASFLEKAHAHDMRAMLQCTIELPPARQGEVFDASRALRTALRIRSGIRGALAHKAGKLLHPRQRGLGLPPSQAAEGWTYAAIHARRDSVKENSLRRLEKLDKGASTPETPLERLKNALVNPKTLPRQEILGNVVPLLGRGGPFMDDEHAQRTGGFIARHLWDLDHSGKSRLLASMLVTRSALARAGTRLDTGEPAEERPYPWLDRLIDSLSGQVPNAFVEVRDDRVAQAMLDWLCEHVKGKVTPSPKLRRLVALVHVVATTLPDGPRKDMLLQGLLATKDAVSQDHPCQLLLNSALRVAGEEWAARINRPNLINEIRQQELQLYPYLIAHGHTFGKHVQGHHNAHNGREFDRLIGAGGDRETRRERFEDLIRGIMRAPTDLYIDETFRLNFYDADKRVLVLADPRRNDGGTAYTNGTESWARKVFAMPCTKLPSDTYSNLEAPPLTPQAPSASSASAITPTIPPSGSGRARDAQITLADGSAVQGFKVRARAGSTTELPAFRTLDDPLGYHEAQQGAQCGRHTLNMVDPGARLATQDEYRSFLKAKYEAQPPRVAVPGAGSRPATVPEIADMIKKDCGESLCAIAEFQAWRRDQGVTGATPMSAGVGNVDRPDTMTAAMRDLQGARAFGVGYQKKGKSAQHNVAIRLGQDGVFRVFDSQKPKPQELQGRTAVEALRDFMATQAARVPQFGLQFEYLVPRRESGALSVG